LTDDGTDFKFTRPLYHPNIYPDGKLCISILHSPGHDEMSGESAGERWSPVQRVESVLLSIISLLDDAECSSPANVDAGVMLRNDFAGYKVKVKEDVEASKKDVPEGFVMPTHESTIKKPSTIVEVDDAAFWAESDEEGDFGGSDTDSESGQDDEDDDDVEMPDTEDEAIDAESMEGDDETDIVAGKARS